MDTCIFCKIVRGELPSYKVYEDEQTYAFLDIHPVNAGHVLVIPKKPGIATIFDVSPEDWGHIAETVRKVAHAVEKGTNADGVNIVMNNREHAGQIIREHLHVHIVPRFKHDGLKHWHQRVYEKGEAEETQKKIRGAM